MKISKREKILLGILIVFIVLYGYFKYIYSRQSEKVEILKSEKVTLENKLSMTNLQIASINNKESELKILNSRIQEKSKLLYPTIAQEKIIIELDDIMAKSSISGTINFSDISVEGVEPNKVEEKKNTESSLQPLVNQFNIIMNNQLQKQDVKDRGNSSNKSANNKGNTAEQMKVSLTFGGSYDNVMSFIKNIENHPKKIIIMNLSLSQSSKNQVNVACELEFYAVPKLNGEDKEYMKWSYNNSYGKLNPFDGGAAVGANTIEEASKTKKDINDFVMSVRSINSDLPTIMLGKSGDSGKNTYVYADSNSKEKVELFITKNQDKYYYKYRTSRGSYPMQFNGDGVQFKPLGGNISFKIYSNKRLSLEDKSSADIKIINQTDKTISVNIEDDDNVNPRINVTGEGASVDVKRN